MESTITVKALQSSPFSYIYRCRYHMNRHKGIEVIVSSTCITFLRDIVCKTAMQILVMSTVVYIFIFCICFCYFQLITPISAYTLSNKKKICRLLVICRYRVVNFHYKVEVICWCLMATFHMSGNT